MLLMFWSTEISGRYRLHLSILFLLSHIIPLLGKGLPTIPLTSPSNLSRRRESYGTTENQRCSRTASADAYLSTRILSHIVLIEIYLRIYTNINQNYWFSIIFYSIVIEILNNMIIIIQSFHSNSFINIKNILEWKILLLLTTRVTSSSERVKGL